MWNCNVPWMASDAFIAPDAAPDDGYVQLCFMRDGSDRKKRPGRAKMLDVLLGFGNAK